MKTTPVRTPSGQFLLEIFLTSRCNMDCSYCAARYMIHARQPGRLTFTQLKRAAEALFTDRHIRQTYGGRVKISFTGGEPLLEFGLIKKAVRYIGARYPGCEFDISTNGTLLTEEILEFCARNKVGLSVSLDGYNKVNDSHRKLAGGGSAFSLVEGNLRKGLASGKYRGLFHVAATLTSRTIVRLPEVVRYFRRESGFNELEIALEAYETWGQAGLARLRKVLRGLKSRFVASLGPGAGEGDAEACFNEFIFSQARASDCRKLADKAVTLFYDGCFYPCDFVVKPPLEEKYRVGDLRSGIDHQKLEEIASQPMFGEIARKCEFKSGLLSPVERYYWGLVHGYSRARLDSLLESTSRVNQVFHEEMGAYLRLQKVYSRLFLTPGFGDFAHEPKYRADKEVKSLRLVIDAGSDLVRLRAAADYCLYSPGGNKRLLLDASGGGQAALDLAEGVALYVLVKAARLKKKVSLAVAAAAGPGGAGRKWLPEHGIRAAARAEGGRDPA